VIISDEGDCETQMLAVLFTSDKGGGTCFCPCLSVCLPVSQITQNGCMDLEEILRVDRCRDMDVTFMSEVKSEYRNL